MILIVMGVSGAGKSTIGQELADALGWPFVEGDDLHPTANIQKMSQGIALTDRDRWPWLYQLRNQIEDLLSHHQSAIVTCSALKRSYRQVLRPDANKAVRFVYLKGDAATVRSRLSDREGHFMKVDMLNSQLDTLEEPKEAITIDIAKLTSPEQIVAQIRAQLDL